MAIEHAEQYLPVRNRPLKNGLGIILHETEFDRNPNVILALLYKGQYATWSADKDGNTFWGHYFNATSQGLEQALADYKDKCAKYTDFTEHGKEKNIEQVGGADANNHET